MNTILYPIQLRQIIVNDTENKDHLIQLVLKTYQNILWRKWLVVIQFFSILSFFNFKENLSRASCSQMLSIFVIIRRAWRNGSAFDSRSKGWVFESPCPQIFLLSNKTIQLFKLFSIEQICGISSFICFLI